MLVIRDEQKNSLRLAMREQFQLALEDELRADFPDAAGALGEGELSALVAWAVERAPRYAIESAAGIAVFAKISLALGEYFDEDPDLPFAADILAGQRHRTELEKLSALVEATALYLGTAEGGAPVDHSASAYKA